MIRPPSSFEVTLKVAAFVAKLRAGEDAFEDEASEGRSRSLGASLSYGFESTFGEEDKKILALLHLFQGFVDVDTLRIMGDPDADWCLLEVRGLTREAGMVLLDRAAEIGLLSAHGGGYYSIHPAVPWFFRGMFDEHYPAAQRADGGSDATSSMRAYVEAMGQLGNFYARQYAGGQRDHLTILEAEEPNLLHAWNLARSHGWWGRAISTMQGLHKLYEHAGRLAEWARLVAAVKDDFVDPETNAPLPGREEDWGLVNQYRVRLAQGAREWEEAERLQQADVRWERERAVAALSLPIEALDAHQKHRIQSLGASLHELGQIQRKRGQADCVASYAEAAEMAKRAGYRTGEAVVAFSLGTAYMQIPAACDLAEAERWYRRSLEMYDEEQRHDRAQCMAQLGSVAYRRFIEARAAKRSKNEILEHLNAARRSYREALDLLPPDAVSDLASIHNQLGGIYSDAGYIDRALEHYQDSIRYHEKQGNLYGAAQARFNVAVGLAEAGRLADARAYTLAALHNFETYGDRTAEDIADTQHLLAEIDHFLTPKPS